MEKAKAQSQPHKRLHRSLLPENRSPITEPTLEYNLTEREEKRMSRVPALAEYPPIERLLDLEPKMVYHHLGLFASRICLVLERFLTIKSYRVPSAEPLKESITLFEIVREEAIRLGSLETALLVFDVKDLMSTMMRLIVKSHVKDGLHIQQFCEQSIDTLKLLLNDPPYVSEAAVQNLYDFFNSLEDIALEDDEKMLITVFS